METSRDDFVIAIRSAFLKKGTQQRFSLLGLILFSIIFLVLGSLNFKAINYIKIGINEVVYRSSFIISGPENFIKNNYLVIQNHFNLYKINEKNKSELAALRSKDLLNDFIILENTPPELSADLVDMGLTLTGGGALLKNIDKRFSKETGLPVHVADDPLACVAIGTGKALDQEETFSTMLSEY